MSDLVEQLHAYGDQLESAVTPYRFDPEATHPTDDAPGSGAASPAAASRWPWMIGLAVVTLCVALALALAFARSGSDAPDPAAASEPIEEEVAAVALPDDTSPEANASAEEDIGRVEEGAVETDNGTDPDDAIGAAVGGSVGAATEPPTEPATGESQEPAAPPSPCGGEGPVVMADGVTGADPGVGGEFTMLEGADNTVPLTLIDGGMSPCFDLQREYSVGDVGNQTIEVTVVLLGEPNSNFDRAYTKLTQTAAVIDEGNGFFVVRNETTASLTLWDGRPPQLPPQLTAFQKSSVGRVVEHVYHPSGLEVGFNDSDPTRTGIAAAALVPTTPIGVGAQWDSLNGKTRYELTDVSNDVATITSTTTQVLNGVELSTVGLLWVDLNNPFNDGSEFFSEFLSGGIYQANHILVGSPPCGRSIDMRTDLPFAGLTIGADFATIEQRAACAFGEVVDAGSDTGWAECWSEDGPITRRTILWGSFALHFEIVEERETFLGWTFVVDNEGNALPGGAQPDEIELPEGLDFTMTIEEIATVLGAEIETIDPVDEDDLVKRRVRGAGVEFVSTDESLTLGVPVVFECIPDPLI